ncbi:MAG: RloB family protein [Clostridiales bacterium]|jgi:hypothetical protein|nr:RloB family protein [Clostridiales bacterium]
MSKKPLKHGDQKVIDERLRLKAAKKIRRTEELPLLPPITKIFCEGTKTEPHYLKEIVNSITERYKKYAMENRISLDDVVQIEGVARSGKSLLEYAKKHVPTDVVNVWLVYDKDDFPPEQFNVTPKMAAAETKKGKVNYSTAWSNECIELWFLLHFQDLYSNISRELYIEKLREHYPAYTKSSTDVYTQLKTKTNDAIKRAKKLYESFEPEKTPSEKAPCTMVYKLVEFLLEYIEH